ncbi:MAG TPA: hypothetical protein VGQ91_03985 [Ideonella sp.]|jgi:hypothetical protein|nr:hypothetical protein [Ideonella sp.]
MHLVLPFASAASPAAGQALSTLHLPMLERLLARLDARERDEGDEFSLSPPHERALARAWGWPAADGGLPFAALAARRDGLPVSPGTDGWGLLSPAHWYVGTEQISLGDPAALALDAISSHALFDALAPLFADEGWALYWGAPARWYATHTSLAELPTASLDRVIGRNIDLWLTQHPQARAVRRLQSEAQMLLYNHPLNEHREAEGLLPVNSFWLSGTGVTQAAPANGQPLVDHRLRAPALAEDWTSWAEAWAALDAGPVAELLRAAEGGTDVTLTLCGERHAQTFAAAPRPWWRRGLLAPRRTNPAPILAAL